jgi:hypothetical protein
MDKDKTIQKAIVCLYLRKRRARRSIKRYAKAIGSRDMSRFEELRLRSLQAAENEAHNALESVSRVLYESNWT